MLAFMTALWWPEAGVGWERRQRQLIHGLPRQRDLS